MIGLFGVFQEQQAEIALAFALPDSPILVAGMIDDNVRELYGAAGAANGRQDLLVDPMFPANARVIAEKADMIDYRGRAVFRIGKTGAFHYICAIFVTEAGQKLLETLA